MEKFKVKDINFKHKRNKQKERKSILIITGVVKEKKKSKNQHSSKPKVCTVVFIMEVGKSPHEARLDVLRIQAPPHPQTFIRRRAQANHGHWGWGPQAERCNKVDSNEGRPNLRYHSSAQRRAGRIATPSGPTVTQSPTLGARSCDFWRCHRRRFIRL